MEKVHATIPKGIVGGFELTVLQRNLKQWHARPWTYVCDCQRKITKAGDSYPILPFGIVACTYFPTTFLEIAVYKAKELWPNNCLSSQSGFCFFGI